ncbi:MAG: hypothetical protein OXC91_11430 [Rhodobacteraceae bacterium]|nr:hypothetical protein [Paracoccaceae bacterium]
MARKLDRNTRRERRFILSAVAEVTDRFIDEYLHVNAKACEGP